MTDSASSPPESLIPHFKLQEILNQDQAGRRTTLRGTIHSQPALLTLERAPFPTTPTPFETLPATLLNLKNLGANDVYFWYLANNPSNSPDPDLKVNLIWPCTDSHIRKYSRQSARCVTETAQIYRERIRPYIERKRAEGRLNWVWNIIDGRTEVEDVIFRTPQDSGKINEEGFLLLPDLNWDRKTIESLHLLGLVERRDIWSLRDLKKKHVPWLREMRSRFVEATVKMYGDRGVDDDLLKMYVHYQPTYYHFHVHVAHVALEAGATQATGKAIGLESIISMLEVMGGGDEAGMDSEGVDLVYTVGEENELWKEVFEAAKKERPRIESSQ